ncbi:amino acid adenylation domain-containing protein [Paenibacillus spiritus]|uniref:Amino acid adenylation domain-containing protein n=1 Tax=Paenibacillus spiritus TaxID=2496557 RepID=A0A5J5GKE4_9BACL|nr:non-ribosomal peptide synthetase [Paenibacillus spiritus]KAA9008675.1 amino acid adenylation domain-containing protein [Paenibacillus spiritus]
MSTLSNLKEYILGRVKDGGIDKQAAFRLLKDLQGLNAKGGEIAVIGMACRYPDADSPEQFWSNLRAGLDSVGAFPEKRKNQIEPFLPPRGEEAGSPYFEAGFLERIDQFDAAFFRIAPREAERMDPYQRLFLETVYHTFEDAGYGGNKLHGSDTGIFVGTDHTNKVKAAYLNFIPRHDFNDLVGSWTSILASRVSYLLDLKGPSMVVDTACSSGLVSVHLACKALQNKECSMAVAGGINLFLTPMNSNLDDVEAGGSGSVIRAFDKRAEGILWGEGVNALLLKPLEQALADGDHIYAVVKGSAINNNGATNGITAPSAEAQEEVIVKAWEDAGINPETLNYVETFAAGTLLGDSIEIKGLSNAFARYTDKRQFCGVGSVKPNIGHNVGASGISSVMKVIMAMQHRQLPPSIHFDEPNPFIHFCESPLYLNDNLIPWDVGAIPRRAGVSAFGFSGTNCHVVLEEAPGLETVQQADEPHLFTMSAQKGSLLMKLADTYLEWLADGQDTPIGDICYTVNTGRKHNECRAALLVRNIGELTNGLRELLRAGNCAESHTRQADKAAQYRMGQEADKLIAEYVKGGKSDSDRLARLGTLYESGAGIDWEALYQGESRRKVSLPGYPYESVSYWLQAPQRGNAEAAAARPSLELTPDIGMPEPVRLYGEPDEAFTETQHLAAAVWGQVLGYRELNIDANYYELGGNSIQAMKITNIAGTRLETEIAAADLVQYPTVRLFASLLESRRADGRVYTPIEPAPFQAVYEVSSAQKRIYLQELQEPGNTRYNLPLAFILRGSLDEKRLERAFSDVIRRHETLRTSFHLENESPVQRIHDEFDFRIQRLHAEPGYGQPDEMIRAFVQPFDLSQAPLFRAALAPWGEEEHLLLLDMHHIVSDGASMEILVREFAGRYIGKSAWPELRAQYKDFSEWQNRYLSSPGMQEKEAYWLSKFDGELPVLNLPLDYSRPKRFSFEGDRVRFQTDGKLAGRLKRLAAAEKTTLYTVLLTAFYTLLHRYTEQEDIVVGSPTAGRQHPDAEHLIGMFVNTVAIRSYPSARKTFRQLLEEVKTSVREAFEHQDYQFEALVDRLGLKRELSRSPLFDVMFVQQQAENPAFEAENLRFIPCPVDSRTAKFDLVLQTLSAADDIKLELEFCSQLFARETAERMAEHYLQILEHIAADPDAVLSEIRLLSSGEEKQLMEEFAGSAAGYDGGLTIQRLFEQQAGQDPGRIAVVFGEQQIAYGELNGRANRLARRLRERGVAPDQIVALMVRPSIEMIVAILGVLKAGGAYLPIDPDYPDDRIRYLLEDSRAQWMVADDEKAGTPFFAGDRILLQDASLEELDESNLDNLSQAGDLAYIIYTSGSTGRPKGVMIEHRNLVRLLFNDTPAYDFHPDDTWTLFHSYCFDFSVWEIFGAVLNGGKLVIVPKGTARDPNRFLKLLVDQQVTVLNQTPTAFYQLTERACSENLPLKLRYVIFGGEALAPVHLRKWKQSYPFVRYINMYGITETTVHVTYKEITQADIDKNISNIGRPIPTLRCYLLDRNRKPVPIGVPGEMFVAGAGLARGYLNQPDLTSGRFVAVEGIPEELLYASGDLARWTPEGNLEYLGRIDHQVKIRGYRIELEEIQSCLLEYEAVIEAYVMDRRTEAGHPYLCAYLVTAPAFELGELRQFVSGKLPEYMIPAYWVPMDKLPLTSNGKLDRSALPEPVVQPTAGKNELPLQNEAERQLAAVWKSILRVEDVGRSDHFFELGGDSIQAIQVVARMNRAGYKLDTGDLFAHPTIEALALRVTRLDQLADQDAAAGDVTLTPIQHWFFEQQFQEQHHWNQSFMLYRREGFDEHALKKVLQRIAEHHDSLRLVFFRSEGAWKARYREITETLFGWTAMDISDVEADTGADRIRAAIEEQANRIQRSNDLGKGPLLQAGLFKTASGDHLLLSVHHLVVDGVSWRILLEDLEHGYEQAAAGKAIILAPKTDSFQKWAETLRRYSAEEEVRTQAEYWRSVEQAGWDSVPLDKPAAAAAVRTGGTVKCVLDEIMTGQLLKEIHHVYRTEINDILLSALGLAFHRWGGMSRIGVCLEGHGREEIGERLNISRTVGWFTTLYPVVIGVEEGRGLQDYILETRRTLRKVPQHGIGYGLLKYSGQDVGPNGEDRGRELPPIVFNYLGQFDDGSGDYQLSPYSTGNWTSPESQRTAVLDIHARVTQGSLQLEFGYSREQYEDSTVEKLARNFENAIREIVEHCLSQEPSKRSSADLLFTGLTASELEDVSRRTADLGEIENIFSLTPMQKGILFHSRLNPRSAVYVEQLTFDLSGHIDPVLLELSVNHFISRHDALRTVFMNSKGGDFLQVVLKSRELKLNIQDIRDCSEEERTRRIEAFKAKDRERGFSLESGPLMRLTGFVREDSLLHMVWSFHHIIMDGWCMPLLFQEVFSILEAQSSGQTLEIEQGASYGKYLEWLGHQHLEQSGRFWNDYLTGFEQPTLLPYTTGGSGSGDYRLEERTFRLGKEESSRLSQFAARNRSTLSTLIQTAWGIVLQKYNQTDDCVFGTVVSGRTADVAEIGQMIGLFINTIPVRVQTRPEETFAECVARHQQLALSAVEHHHYPLYEVQAGHTLKQDLIQHLLVFENYPISEMELGGEAGSLRLGNVHVREQTNYDFNLVIFPGTELTVKFCYNGNVYTDEAIARIQGHFEQVLMQLIRNPSVRVAEVELASADEKRTLLQAFNPAPTASGPIQTLHRLFEKQAEQFADKPAVETGEQRLTYAQLNARANQLARVLRHKGVGQDQLVGLLVERSVEMMVGIMAILKAGGAYLPIDPHNPDERLCYLLEDSKTPIILTQTRHVRRLQKLSSLSLIDLEDGGLYTGDSTNLPGGAERENLAYVIYTSGSTGNPKGVMIEHHSVINRIEWMHKQYPISADDVILQKTPYTFDVSVWELFWWFLAGAKLCFLNPGGEKNPADIVGAVSKHQVTVMHFVPSMLTLFLEYVHGRELGGLLASVRRVFASGEALHMRQVQQFHRILHQTNGTQLHNLYGPTEATVDVSYYDCTDPAQKDLVPIGRPIDNIRLYVVNSHYQLLPVGVSGELCISGAGVARGYLNRPELTEEKFVPDPFCEGERMYRTGDLARWMPDGNIEYLGRIDHQVKIRGYRIELGEIEAQLLKHPDMTEALVTDRTDSAGDKYLCAYVVCGREITVKEFREFLGRSLMEYMIPAYFIRLERMPLTSNGKISRRDLPAPEAEQITGSEYEEASNQVEEKLVAIWKRLLNLKKLSVHDDFFALGGNSLQLISLEAEMNREHLYANLTDVYQHRTIRRLAEFLASSVPVDPESPAEPGRFITYRELPAMENPEQPGIEMASAEGVSDNRLLPAVENGGMKRLRIRLQNKIICYTHNSYLLCILLGYDNMLPWFYENYVQLYYSPSKRLRIKDSEEIWLDFYGGWNEPRRFFDYKYYQREFLADQDIIRFIEGRIDRNQYFHTYLDEFYTIQQGREHFVHDIFVYGYDREKRLVHVIGFNAKREFVAYELDYDRFRIAFEEGVRLSRTLDENGGDYYGLEIKCIVDDSYTHSYRLDQLLDQLHDYLHSVNTARKRKIDEYLYCLSDNVFGRDTYAYILDHLKHVREQEGVPDYRAFHTLYEHKKGLSERIQYLAGLYPELPQLKPMAEQFEKLTQSFNLARLSALRYLVIKDIGLVDSMIALVSRGQEEEGVILTELYRLLDAFHKERAIAAL